MQMYAEVQPTAGAHQVPTDIDLSELDRLIAEGAQLIEVLPVVEYAEEHLPDAINIPLRKLDAGAVAALDHERPVIVYCWDSL